MKPITDYIEFIRDLILASLLVLVPVVIDGHIRIGAGPETKFRLFEYGVLLAGLFSLPRWAGRNRKLAWRSGSVAIGLFLAYLFGRAWLDPHRDYALDQFLTFASWLVFAWLIADACPAPARFARMLWIMAWGQLGPVILAMGNIFGVDIYLHWILRQPDWKWASELIGADRGIIWSSLGNPNFYANYGAMVLLWLITLMFLTRRRWIRALLGLYAAILLITLIYTFTRGIWASLVPTFFILLAFGAAQSWLSRRSLSSTIRHYGKSAAALGLAMVLLLSAAYAMESREGPFHKIGKRFQNAILMRDTSLRSRPLMWYAALRMWRDRPFTGLGWGQYAPRYLETVYQSAQETEPARIQQITRSMNTIWTDLAHNDYLQLLAETGLAGYALFLLFLLTILGTAARALWPMDLSRARRILLTGCFAIVLMTSLQCVYDFPLHLPASAILFALAAGGILALAPDPDARVPGFSGPRAGRWLTALALTPILAAGGIFVVTHVLASHFHEQGSRQLQAGIDFIFKNQETAVARFRQAERDLQRAGTLFPGNGQILYDRGRVCAYLRDSSRAIDLLLRAKETYCVPEMYRVLCDQYLQLNRTAQARRAAEILLLIDPDRKETQYLAGVVDFREGNYPAAAAHFQDELRINPENDRAWGYLGDIYTTQEQWEQAARMYEKALEIVPRSVDIRERLADRYAQLKDRERARQHYELALEGARLLPDPTYKQRIEWKLKDLEPIQAQP
ncbi:MAG: O-antigen ligase family protein [bacterium]